jgi:TRAP-type C4-dicarboxylate transport system permease large subunit
VLQGMTGKDIFTVGKAALPFFCLMVIAVVLIWIFPEIVTYLPRHMLGTR